MNQCLIEMCTAVYRDIFKEGYHTVFTCTIIQ